MNEAAATKFVYCALSPDLAPPDAVCAICTRTVHDGSELITAVEATAEQGYQPPLLFHRDCL